MQVTQEHVDDFIYKLKGRLAYETKKAIKLGFPSIQEYAKQKLIKRAEEEKQKVLTLPAVKTVKVKSAKKKAIEASSCGCCP